MTVAPEATVWSAPALAVGAWFTGDGGFTVTTTVSVSQSGAGSQTSNWKVSVAGPVGAVNDGVAVLAPVRVTAVPARLGPRVGERVAIRIGRAATG